MSTQVRLYALKSGDDYVKFADAAYVLTTMHKASVFSNVDDLKGAAENLLGDGFRIVELTITERELDDADGEDE